MEANSLRKNRQAYEDAPEPVNSIFGWSFDTNWRRPQQSINDVNVADPLLFSSVDNDLDFEAKPIYEVGVNHRTSAKAIYTAVVLLYTKAGLDLISSATIQSGWWSSIKEYAPPKIPTATRKPFQIEVPIML